MAKRILFPYVIESAKSMGASFTTTPTSIRNFDRVAFYISCTGTPTGTLSIQGSNDYNSPGLTAHWVDLNLGLSPLAGAAAEFFIDIPQTAIQWLRIKYVKSGSTGTMYATISAKEA